MQKKLFSIIILATIVSNSQANTYSIAELREVKNITAAMRASGAAIAAVSQSGMSDELKLITGLARELNKFSANAIKEQSQVVRVARVLERISFEAPLQDANFADSLFYKKLTLALAHCITRDIVLSYKNKGVNLVLNTLSDSRLLAEITHALTKGLAVAAIDTSFSHVKSTCIPGKSAPKDLWRFFFERFVATATKDLAYRVAGEIIRKNANDTTRSELFADVFDPSNEENLF